MNARDFPLVKDGCVIYRDLTGYSFGRLHVLSRVIRRRTRKRQQNLHWWKCKCVCGKIHYADTEPLITGSIQSCGCLSRNGNNRYGICPAFRAIIIDHRINTMKPTAEIGSYFGITKNSVIGILDRAGMCESKEPEPITMEERLGRYTFPTTRQCAYPHGRPFEDGFKWCLAPVKPESSYCPEHHAACYLDEKTRTSGSMATADLTQSRPTRAKAGASILTVVEAA